MLLEQQNGDMNQFFNVVKDISKLSKEERSFVLQAVAQARVGRGMLDGSSELID